MNLDSRVIGSHARIAGKVPRHLNIPMTDSEIGLEPAHADKTAKMPGTCSALSQLEKMGATTARAKGTRSRILRVSVGLTTQFKPII